MGVKSLKRKKSLQLSEEIYVLPGGVQVLIIHNDWDIFKKSV
jgi:hypothetical protein